MTLRNLLILENDDLEQTLNTINDKLDYNIIYRICKLIADDFEETYFDNNYNYVHIYEMLLKLTQLKYRGNIKDSIIILEDLYNFTFDDKFSFYHNDDVLKSIALLKNLKY